jgi:hypothetical protein
VKNEEIFFLLIHNTLINKMDSYGIEKTDISSVMSQVFGSQPNSENLKHFFNNQVI